MLTKIYISKNIQARSGAIKNYLSSIGISVPSVDLLYLEDQEKIGIEKIRETKGFLKLKPLKEKFRCLVIESLHSLKPESQNALLKTLEEPLFNNLIVLGSNSETDILSTILSRCRIEYTEEKESLPDEKALQEIAGLIGLSLEDRFMFIEKLEQKKEFLENLEVFFEMKLRENILYAQFAKDILKAKQMEQANVNIRAILEMLMLKMPRQL